MLVGGRAYREEHNLDMRIGRYRSYPRMISSFEDIYIYLVTVTVTAILTFSLYGNINTLLFHGKEA